MPHLSRLSRTLTLGGAELRLVPSSGCSADLDPRCWFTHVSSVDHDVSQSSYLDFDGSRLTGYGIQIGGGTAAASNAWRWLSMPLISGSVCSASRVCIRGDLATWASASRIIALCSGDEPELHDCWRLQVSDRLTFVVRGSAIEGFMFERPYAHFGDAGPCEPSRAMALVELVRLCGSAKLFERGDRVYRAEVQRAADEVGRWGGLVGDAAIRAAAAILGRC
jgi:hypothetical protein